jgi:excisionase family DNA binding protein
MPQSSISPDKEQRLVVSPRRALHLLDCGRTHLYELIGKGELDSFLDGRSRKITVESIHRYIEWRLSQNANESKVSQHREHGGLRKNGDTEFTP